MQTRLLPVFVLAIVLSLTSNTFAAIYKYIDENGIICFADDLQSVPEKCRATAKLVSGGQEVERKPAIQKHLQTQVDARTENAASATDRENSPIEVQTKSFFGSRALISVVVAVSGLFAFVILGIIDNDHTKAIKIVRVVLVWGMSVYLIVAHGGDFVHMFKTLGGKVETVQRESEEKGKKAAKALKEMNALMQQVDQETSQDSGSGEPAKKD